MKLIRLNESQYNRLFEASETLIDLGTTGDPNSNPPTNINGQEEISNSAVPGERGTDTDEFQKTQTNNDRRWGNKF